MKIIENNTYLVPLIVIIGTLGNTLSIIIYSRPTFNTRTIPIGFYFRLLALVDLICLLQFTQYFFLDHYDVDFKSHSRLVCTLSMLMLFIPPGVSAWLEAAISLDRMFFLTRPGRLLILKRRTFQVGVVLAIVLANTGLYLPLVLDYDVLQENTTVQFDSLSLSNRCVMMNARSKLIVVWLDLVNFSILPLTLMSFSSYFMVSTLFKSRDSLFRNLANMSNSRRRDIKDKHFAVSSVALNLIYLVCNMPITVINLIQFYVVNEVTHVVFVVALHLFFVKFSLPFFVYMVVNTNFRIQFFKLFDA